MVLKFITLNDNNVERYAKNMQDTNTVHVVAFLADWCGHCQRFKPEWKKIKKHLKSKKHLYNGYVVTACDKTMNNIPCDVKPRGFPTISLFKGTKHIRDFSEERNYINVLNFIKNNVIKNNKTQSRNNKTKGKNNKSQQKKNKKGKKSRKKLKKTNKYIL